MIGLPTRFGMGYGLSSETMPIGPRACYWGGYGGSLIVIDQDQDLAVSYVMNRMESGVVGDERRRHHLGGDDESAGVVRAGGVGAPPGGVGERAGERVACGRRRGRVRGGAAGSAPLLRSPPSSAGPTARRSPPSSLPA